MRYAMLSPGAFSFALTPLRLSASLILTLLFLSSHCYAMEENVYRQIFTLESRKVVWFLAQLHLFFGAFALGVPLFAVIIEIAGRYKRDRKYDRLAQEFTALLSLAFAVTAMLGVLLAFALIYLYPSLTGYMAGIFGNTLPLYGLLFFCETLSLAVYYYGWERLRGEEAYPPVLRVITKSLGLLLLLAGLIFLWGQAGPELRTDTRIFLTLFYCLPLSAGLYFLKDKKSLHIFSGLLLIIFGTAIMQTATSWTAFMMSPGGIDMAADLVTSRWEAFDNPLATPLAIHRMLGNLVFGGLMAGAYAAVRFMAAESDKARAHYDWMGYVSSLVAIMALIPLPFAGYYLGREIYAVSPIMGNNMMGGDFSWTFILQALLVGALFLVSNYYLWCGMTRIPGAGQYLRYIKFILLALVISLAVWLTPHNLPLSGAEVSLMGGGQHHPLFKYLGLMPAKNAVVNLIILATFYSFLLYRRGSRGMEAAVIRPKTVALVLMGGLLAVAMVGQYALHLARLDPAEFNVGAEGIGYMKTTANVLYLQCFFAVIAVILSLLGRGRQGQHLYLAFTALSAVGFFGVYGFVVMKDASSMLGKIAVGQFLQVMSCLLLLFVIDISLSGKKAQGRAYLWGKMTIRSQYALIFLAIVATLTMGLMGFIRSGLRGEWHVYGVMRDTSPWAHRPSDLDMSLMVAFLILLFFLGLALIFRLCLTDKGDEHD